MIIDYQTGNDLNLDAVLDLYHASTLGERRPVNDRRRMGDMLSNSNLVITAWEGNQMIGLSRALTDFRFVTYLSDLAVRVSHQRQGVGRELIRRTRAAAPEAMLLLLAAPAAQEYYPRLGFNRHPQAWFLERDQELK
jgi:predicted N-acetyltransferase YhbS